MRNSLVVGVLLGFAATAAMAQTQTPPAQNGPQNKAVNSSEQHVSAPVKGANSFTEGEAKSRIEARGYTNVTNLKKDDNGVWRGRAMKAGSQVDVGLDYQGNVVEGNAAGQGSTVPMNPPAGSSGR